MGRGWINTIKTANAAKKGAQFTKLIKEITVASRMGGPDPAGNSRLRLAIEAAQAASCPRDNIERAIKRGAGTLDDGAIIEEIMYEGYGPHGVGVLVEAQTDNRNRTAPEMRTMFKEHGGSLGEQGSVAWMFERISSLEAKRKTPAEDLETEAIEVGANEVESGPDGTTIFIGSPEDLDQIRTALTSRGWQVTAAELSFRAKNKTSLNAEQRKEVQDFLTELDEHDDTKQIFVTLD